MFKKYFNEIQKRFIDTAKTAGFSVGTKVCGLFVEGVYDGKIASMNIDDGFVVKWSDGDVKKYTQVIQGNCLIIKYYIAYHGRIRLRIVPLHYITQ